MPVFVRLSNKSAYGRIFYNILLHKFKYNTNFLVKWEQEFDIIENIKNNNFMMKYITNAFQYTNDITLRWFQYRISHRILATNKYLSKIKIKDSKLCTFCNIELESLIHLFVECEHVENVWHMLENWILDTCGFLLNYYKREILFGKIGKKYQACNISILIVKYYIYKRRCNKTALYFEGIKREIKNYYIIDKYIAKLVGKCITFEEKYVDRARSAPALKYGLSVYALSTVSSYVCQSTGFNNVSENTEDQTFNISLWYTMWLINCTLPSAGGLCVLTVRVLPFIPSIATQFQFERNSGKITG